MVKVKVSHTIDKQLVDWLENEIETKRFASISHGIEYALTVLKDALTVLKATKIQTIQPQTSKRSDEGSEISELSSPDNTIALEVLRQNWWDDKQIGEGIVKAGGMGIINLTNIIQKNPNLFETKEECKAWLQNKINTSPPIIVLPEKIKAKRAKNPQTISTTAGPPQFTPRRTTAKCPGCSEEILILGTTKVLKCRNCGADVSILNGSHQPEPHAPMQDVLLD